MPASVPARRVRPVLRVGNRYGLDEVQYRDYAVPDGSIDVDARTVELAFSSEQPYGRWWGTEILSHEPGAIRMGRMANGAALLVDHDSRDQVGVIVRAWIGNDRMARAIVRFGRSVRASEVFQDVQDGIRKLVSVGYRIHEMVLEKSSNDGEDNTYRITDWEPFEVSLVAVPADSTVGVGRSLTPPQLRHPITHQESAMDEDENTVTEVAPTQQRQQPSVAELTRAAIVAERARRDGIVALGRQHDQADLAERAVSEGLTLDAFRSQLLAPGVLRPSATLTPAEDPNIGMGSRDLERFSFRRALLAASDPLNTQLRNDAAFEFECSEAARGRQGNRPTNREAGITIPPDVLNASMALPVGAAQSAARMLMGRALEGAAYRDLVVGTATAGGNTVATNLLAGSFIDLLRNRARIIEMGATLFRDLNGNVAIPRQSGAASTYWVAENGAPTESQQTVDQVTMTPKTIGAFTDYSRRLLLQSSLDIEAFVRADLAMIMALGIDAAALNGTGASNQPTGLLNTAGIGAVVGGTNGAAPTWDHAVLLEEAVAVANADIGRLSYLTNAKVRSKLKRTQKFTSTNGAEVWGRGREPGNGIGELNAYDAFVSNQVPANLTKGTSTGTCSAIAFGNWADLFIGLWGGLDLMLDPYTGATSGTKRVIALQDCDIALRRPTSFAVMLDALPA